MKNCKICKEKTDVVFNIMLEATPICESCATSIFLQQATYYVKQSPIIKKQKIELCKCDKAFGLKEMGEGKYVCKVCKKPISCYV